MLSVLILSLLTMKAERPPQLPDKPGCEHYRGTASGNDPRTRLDVVLCPDGDQLRGEVQWSSLQSGWNLRKVAGTRRGGTVTLRDLEVTQSRPEPGWVFCEIENYALHETDQGLQGTYTSRACNDSANVTLQRVPGSAAQLPVEQPVEERTPRTDSEPPAPSRGPSTPKAARDPGCACGGTQSSASWSWLVVLAAAGRVRKRPRASGEHRTRSA